MTAKVLKLPDISASHATALEAVDFAVNFMVELLGRPRYPVPKGVFEGIVAEKLPEVFVETDPKFIGLKKLQLASLN